MKADEQTSALRTGTIQYMFHTTSYITRSFKSWVLLDYQAWFRTCTPMVS